ncbi:MAG: SUMF1/EgtB/PvdO family nonheme iron enzyme [bacterium]|nr:SUMF1/EgtB/PvdO family nonheme iron enzyme [bacterium]
MTNVPPFGSGAVPYASTVVRALVDWEVVLTPVAPSPLDVPESVTMTDIITEATAPRTQDEQPVHTVALDGYFIDKYEVTNAQYVAFVTAGGGEASHYADDSNYNAPQYPVVGVSWFDAEKYCDWAGLRLPTEAEWEKAARGTDGRTYPWGSGTNFMRANFRAGHLSRFPELGLSQSLEFHPPRAEIAPVGSHPSGVSPYGVHDMAGNVYEWVADWYDEDYYGVSPDHNPTGPSSGSARVYRGGSWYFNFGSLRAADRNRAEPSDRRSLSLGFRCAQNE